MKKCLIILNTSKPESKIIGEQVAEYLEKKSIASSFFEYDGAFSANPFPGNDFVITLGGDGTVLFAARGCAASGLPIFPVNLGDFGFIASVEKSEWKNQLDNFLAGKAFVGKRTMLESSVLREGKEVFQSVALNDIVVSAQNGPKTISFEVFYNGSSLGVFKADGVILSSATGSTAYSVSAGGPIIDPALDALVLTPINPFSLSGRPLVLHPSGEIKVQIRHSRNAIPGITCDGQLACELKADDVIIVKKSSCKAFLVECTTEKFYTALRLKLNWSGGPHA